MAAVQYFGKFWLRLCHIYRALGYIDDFLQDNLQRFKKEQYNITRNEDLVLFFGDFEEYLTEDEMWTLSETIKPRGSGNKSK